LLVSFPILVTPLYSPLSLRGDEGGLVDGIMTSIKKELEAYGLVPRKKLGQHFLVDQNIVKKVVKTAKIEKDDVVLEVGPGLGMMTLALADQARRVVAVEIDSKLVEILKKKVGGYPHVEVIQKDILEMDFRQLREREGQPIKVVANLPYQISTPLLFQFIETKEAFSSLTLMLQREVAERMIAPPDGKEYGPLSIFTQLVADLSICFFIKPSCFFPPPKVDSAVIHMTWKDRPIVGIQDMDWFKKVVRGCFNYRRKTLINGLKYSGLPLPADSTERMNRVGIDPQRRPESLTLQEFANLAEILKL
jgi:16S rRNA (adenine1518-N6/adenine1519-N6)-dimethyltransferase